MPLTKRSETNAVYLEVKHYCLWRQIKKAVPGCEEIEVNNPSTGEKVKKIGFAYDSVSGIVTKLDKYDTGRQYSTRYFGFNLHLVDSDGGAFVLKMPYASQVLRRFLRLARNIDFKKPLSLTVFKGRKKEGATGAEETGLWFQQNGQTVKPYYTKEQPHGMPDAKHDQFSGEWDFKEQHQWLVARLQAETMADIAAAAKHAAPPDEPEVRELLSAEPDIDEGPSNDFDGITDDDIPF